MIMTYLGFQASSLKPYLTTKKNLLETFYRLKSIGYRYLQLQWIDFSIPLEYTAAALMETGLRCIATQDSFISVKENLDYYLRMNTLWGSKYLCVSAIPKEQMSTTGIITFVSTMNKIAEELEPLNIKLTFHPLSFNFQHIDGESAVDIVMKLLPKNIGITFCILQAVRAGVDPVDFLEKYRGRIDICHYKDYDTSSDGSEYLVPVGQGKIAWQAIFDACQSTGVVWGLAEQEVWQKDAFICAEESFDYISRHGILVPNNIS